MAKNKFSDKEIIKALECYSCMEDGLHEQALDLINRQQETIERLQRLRKQEEKSTNSLTKKCYKDGIKELAGAIINDILPKTMVGYDEKALELSLAISNKIQEMEAGTNECS